MSNILHLTLNKKWFDMIASGEKKEEYREVKPYWIERLTWHEYHQDSMEELIAKDYDRGEDVYRHDFDIVVFRNGYGKKAPTIAVEFIEITINEAKPEWSDNWQGNVFVIKLGEITTYDKAKSKILASL